MSGGGQHAPPPATCIWERKALALLNSSLLRFLRGSALRLPFAGVGHLECLAVNHDTLDGSEAKSKLLPRSTENSQGASLKHKYFRAGNINIPFASSSHSNMS